MFLTLLLVTFLIAAAIATMTAFLFSKPIKKILGRLVSDELARTWLRYLLFAIYVVGISGGVRVWDIEKWITPGKDGQILRIELRPVGN